MPVKIEAKLAQLAVELPGIRLTEQWPFVREQVEMERGRRELHGRKSFEPVPDLWLEFYATPGHSTDAMKIARIELPGRTFMVDTGGSGMTSILISWH